MGWIVERAELSDGRSTHLVIDEDSYAIHPETLEYVHALYAADRSPNTVKTYLRPIARFLTWCVREGVEWRRATIIDMARFKRDVETTPVRGGGLPSRSTVSITLTAVCEFIRYSAAAGHIPAEVPLQLVERKWMPAGATARTRDRGGQMRTVRASVLRTKVAERAPEIISSAHQRVMLDAARTARDLFLLRIMLEGGLRIGEALGLRFEDIHFLPDSTSLGCGYAGAHVHVRRRDRNENGVLAKSYHPRTVPVDVGLVAAYRDYRFERDGRCGVDGAGDYVFVSYSGPRRGHALTYSNVYQMVQRLAKRCGVRVTPHMFRHTAATGWVENGTQVDVVQELLGHAHADSTRVYLHPSHERMRAAVTAITRATA
ncbi:tyrosine-type recombinase/integrase [Microbacterium sp. 22242]|uniref:tyrosine-type recombinase/integrase n=1 Tax=Microbacterium sp. 22242 TaxID=3453896 RepID=UPI003F8261DB